MFSKQHDGIVVQNFILNNSYFILLFYYNHDVVGGYAIEVLCFISTLFCCFGRWNSQFY